MILDAIIENKKIEVEKSKGRRSMESLISGIGSIRPPRDFYKAIDNGGQLRIIAEIKKASPSKGVLREDFDPVKIALGYAKSGASALSVLTDEKFFMGSLKYLSAVREAVDVPLLRKDFIIDPYQVYESKLYGADALLLIVSALGQDALKGLLALTHSLGMNAVVEVHDEGELGRALEAGGRIIGINNRDLRTFEVDLNVSARLARMMPDGVIAIAESGISSGADIKRLREQGVHVFLIGETFMKAPDPGAELKNLISSSISAS
ncbi:MAG: indole-3-glycerol phosphate synthase TrpC [Candidatus Dadabacteria bacterium]|nr:indole-3-glycerol phosphate synthase TrpC [Candidatus Dadabacteria bacterium]